MMLYKKMKLVPVEKQHLLEEPNVNKLEQNNQDMQKILGQKLNDYDKSQQYWQSFLRFLDTYQDIKGTAPPKVQPQPTVARIVQPAVKPEKPSKPKKSRIPKPSPTRTPIKQRLRKRKWISLTS